MMLTVIVGETVGQDRKTIPRTRRNRATDERERWGETGEPRARRTWPKQVHCYVANR